MKQTKPSRQIPIKLRRTNSLPSPFPSTRRKLPGGRLSGHSRTQSVLFDKTKYTINQAQSWLSEHGYRPIKKVHETADKLRFRIEDPSHFKRFRTLKIGPRKDMELIIGFP